MKLVKVLLMMALSLSVLNVVAAEQEVEGRLLKSLQQRFADIDVSGVRPSPIENIYEVIIGPNVIYITDDGRFILKGDLIDMQEKRNLSEDVRLQSRADLLEAIPESEYIEFAPKDSKDTIYVFTDVDCSYCRRLHRDMPKLNDNAITVRYLAFPRGGQSSPTYQEMVDIWCAEDPPQALTDAKNGMPAIVKAKAGDCKSPVDGQYALGVEMGMRGTPAIFLESGRALNGYVPPNELIKELGR